MKWQEFHYTFHLIVNYNKQKNFLIKVDMKDLPHFSKKLQFYFKKYLPSWDFGNHSTDFLVLSFLSAIPKFTIKYKGISI